MFASSRNRHLIPFFVVLLGALVASGCSDSSGRSPTAPDTNVSAIGSATIHGTVTPGNTAGSVTAAPATTGSRSDFRDGGSPRLSGDLPFDSLAAPSAVATSAGSMAGVVVSVRGTDISTVTDSQGRFRLDRVPEGNQVLVFTLPQGGSPALPIENIKPQETIELTVAVTSTSATATSVKRTQGTNNGEEEDDQLDPDKLRLEVNPQAWNLNFKNASGRVTAFIRGEGLDKIDLNSIQMHGDDPDAEALAPVTAALEGNHVRAQFPMNQVIDLLLDPEPGSVHVITVSFANKAGDQTVELTDEITVVGDEEDDGNNGEEEEEEEEIDLRLDMQPDAWNTNWVRSSGLVSAFIRGPGFEKIDLDSIVLIGTDPDAEPLAPVNVRRAGNNVRAQFRQADAFQTLDDPKPGETHTVRIRLTVNDGAEEIELEDTVRIVGPPV